MAMQKNDRMFYLQITSTYGVNTVLKVMIKSVFIKMTHTKSQSS